jgi:tetratricopeptide (TPR) repeat protein
MIPPEAGTAGGAMVNCFPARAASTADLLARVFNPWVMLLLVIALLSLLAALALRGRGNSVASSARRESPSPTPPSPPADTDAASPDAPTAGFPPDPGPAEWSTQDMGGADNARPRTPADAERLEKTDPRAAAVVWGRLGRWQRAACLLEAANEPTEAARIHIALGHAPKAEKLLRGALARTPADEETRALLVSLLFDDDRQREALELVETVIDPDSPIQATAEFLEFVARALEARSQFREAIKYYRRANATEETTGEVPQRILFLKQMQRLTSLARSEDAEGPPSQPSELLQRLLVESSTDVPLPMVADEERPFDSIGHEIIVGHLALGCQQAEPPSSVRSVYAPSRRFQIERLLSETPTSAVFEATDQLLDFTVALKLARLGPLTESQYDTLRERLRLMAKLNHPNLAKITYVDREGPVLRLATEYLPGGNLREFLAKLGGVGVPLLVRMAMHLASALNTAHLRGVPHGDLRPENVLIGPDQRIKLIDFSIRPMPICKIDYSKIKVSESMDTPRIADLLGSHEGIQSDLVQFGDLLEFMLSQARRTVETPPNSADPIEELREVVLRLRNGSFNSVLRLWQVLEQIFERTMPPSNEGRGRG